LTWTDKTLKTADERRAVFEKHGVDLSKEIVLHCQTGVTASVAFTALKDIVGGKLRLYDGSYSEYSQRK